MLSEVAPGARGALRPLFADYPGWHAVLEAMLSGELGAAFADDPVAPTLAVLTLSYDCFVGGRASERAIEAVEGFMRSNKYVVVPQDWAPLLARDPAAFSPRQRTSFDAPKTWDKERLRGFIAALPAGFSIRRVDADTVEAFQALSSALVQNYPSLEAFVGRGIGYGVAYGLRFVSGCASYALCEGLLEIEIQTHPEFRRQGLATAAAAAMILHCIESGIEPCWDAANQPSVLLATKLGYVNPRPYFAYVFNRA